MKFIYEDECQTPFYGLLEYNTPYPLGYILATIDKVLEDNSGTIAIIYINGIHYPIECIYNQDMNRAYEFKSAYIKPDIAEHHIYLRTW